MATLTEKQKKNLKSPEPIPDADIDPKDVLLGRKTNNHPNSAGKNKIYNEKKNLYTYEDWKELKLHEKKLATNKVVEAIKPGRFLKKYHGKYYEVNEGYLRFLLDTYYSNLKEKAKKNAKEQASTKSQRLLNAEWFRSVNETQERFVPVLQELMEKVEAKLFVGTSSEDAKQILESLIPTLENAMEDRSLEICASVTSALGEPVAETNGPAEVSVAPDSLKTSPVARLPGLSDAERHSSIQFRLQTVQPTAAPDNEDSKPPAVVGKQEFDDSTRATAITLDSCSQRTFLPVDDPAIPPVKANGYFFPPSASEYPTDSLRHESKKTSARPPTRTSPQQVHNAQGHGNNPTTGPSPKRRRGEDHDSQLLISDLENGTFGDDFDFLACLPPSGGQSPLSQFDEEFQNLLDETNSI